MCRRSRNSSRRSRRLSSRRWGDGRLGLVAALWRRGLRALHHEDAVVEGRVTGPVVAHVLRGVHVDLDRGGRRLLGRRRRRRSSSSFLALLRSSSRRRLRSGGSGGSGGAGVLVLDYLYR